MAEVAAPEVVVNNAAPQGEFFAVAHIFASFNDTFVVRY